jgi:hypothetical protein
MCGSHEEDHLTEFIGAALDACAEFRRAYVDVLLQPYASRKGWTDPEITAVQTQVNFTGLDGDDRPDLVLKLADSGGASHQVVVEHKIFARESRRPEKRSGASDDAHAEEEVIGQLSRYLRLEGVDGVAYVRLWPQAIDPAVRGHENYIAPAEGNHFLWWHLYAPLAATATCSPVVEWLREGFELDGWTPPRREIPSLHVAGDRLLEKANRREFGKLMEIAKARADDAGWQANFDQDCAELYLRNHPDSWAKRVLFSAIGKPKKARQVGFRVWVTPRPGEEHAAIERLTPVLQSASLPKGLQLFALPNQGGTVELSTGLAALLDGADDVEAVRARFADVVSAFLRCV